MFCSSCMLITSSMLRVPLFYKLQVRWSTRTRRLRMFSVFLRIQTPINILSEPAARLYSEHSLIHRCPVIDTD